MASAGVLARDIRTDHKEIISTASVLADVYIKERLGCPVTSTEKSAPSFTRKFVRLANELEPRHVSQYDDMCSRLVINGRTVYGIFLQTADELFKNGINWGRVVGLYAFAGSLCQTCTSCGLQATVEEVKKWLIAYIRLNLANWIIDQGGWNGFDAHFKDEGGAEHSPQRWMALGLAVMGALALYTAVRS